MTEDFPDVSSALVLAAEATKELMAELQKIEFEMEQEPSKMRPYSLMDDKHRYFNKMWKPLSKPYTQIKRKAIKDTRVNHI